MVMYRRGMVCTPIIAQKKSKRYQAYLVKLILATLVIAAMVSSFK